MNAAETAYARTLIALLLVAAALRAVGDFLPAERNTILNTASYLWMISAMICAWRIWRGFRDEPLPTLKTARSDRAPAG